MALEGRVFALGVVAFVEGLGEGDALGFVSAAGAGHLVPGPVVPELHAPAAVLGVLAHGFRRSRCQREGRFNFGHLRTWSIAQKMKLPHD